MIDLLAKSNDKSVISDKKFVLFLIAILLLRTTFNVSVTSLLGFTYVLFAATFPMFRVNKKLEFENKLEKTLLALSIKKSIFVPLRYVESIFSIFFSTSILAIPAYFFSKEVSHLTAHFQYLSGAILISNLFISTSFLLSHYLYDGKYTQHFFTAYLCLISGYALFLHGKFLLDNSLLKIFSYKETSKGILVLTLCWMLYFFICLIISVYSVKQRERLKEQVV